MYILKYYITIFASTASTAKPFNLAALKVGGFTYKIILAPFILANSNHTFAIQE